MIRLLSSVLVGKVALLLRSHPPTLAGVWEGHSYPPLALKKETRSPWNHPKHWAAFPLRLLFPQLRGFRDVVLLLGIQLLRLGCRGMGCSEWAHPDAHRDDTPSIILRLSPKASGVARGGKEGSSAAGPAAGSPRLLGVETQNNTNRKHIGD